jgi:hypothetical protein
LEVINPTVIPKAGGAGFIKAMEALGPRLGVTFAGVDALSNLTDRNDPFGKNVAEGLGTLGGYGAGFMGTMKLLTPLLKTPAAPAVPIIAALAAPYVGKVGKQAGGGIYQGLNPDGVADHQIRKIKREGKVDQAQAQAMQDVLNIQEEDQMRKQQEAAMFNAYMNSLTGY